MRMQPVENIIETMTAKQKREMLRDVIQNMAERNDNEEIAKFIINQLGGDAVEVAYSYASRK
jgi:hypothetical protein